jgi:hypothetical protein
MSIELNGDQTSFHVIWDELTLISIVVMFCLSRILVAYFKYQNRT